jgi:hypothetical protein
MSLDPFTQNLPWARPCGLALPSRQYGRPERVRAEEKVGIQAPAFVLAQKDGLPMKGLNQVTKNSCQRLFQRFCAATETKLSFTPSRSHAHAPTPRLPRSGDVYDKGRKIS